MALRLGEIVDKTQQESNSDQNQGLGGGKQLLEHHVAVYRGFHVQYMCKNCVTAGPRREIECWEILTLPKGRVDLNFKSFQPP